MKSFLVIFLGLCVILTNAKIQADFSNWDDLDIEKFDETSHEKPGYISGLVNSLFDKLKSEADESIEFLQGKLDKLVNAFVSQVIHFSEFSLIDAEELARDAKAKLILHSDNKTKKCSEDFLPRLEDAITKGKEGVENCVAKAVDEITDVKERVEKHMDAVKVQLSNVVDVLEKCVYVFRPIKTTTCMLENIKSFSSSISDIVFNGYKALEEAFANLQHGSNVQPCIMASANQTEINVKGISGYIDDCLKNN